MADPITMAAVSSMAGGGGAAAALSGAQAGLAAVNMFVGLGQANANARAQYDANMENYALQMSDIDRRTGEANEQAREARSDRVLQANREISQTRLLAMENGVSGSTMDGLVRDLAMAEGMDLGRINKTLQSKKDSLNSERRASAVQTEQNNLIAKNQRKTAATQSILGGVGSGLQIASTHHYQQSRLNALQ